MHEYPEYAVEDQKAVDGGALRELDSELEMLGQEIDRFRDRIAPILRVDMVSETSIPRPVPQSDLRHRIERLSDLRASLVEIRDRVDL